MLRDRYEPMNVLALVSAPDMGLDPLLTELDRLLDDDTLFQAVKADLATRHPRTLTDGRPSTPVEVILRATPTISAISMRRLRRFATGRLDHYGPPD